VHFLRWVLIPAEPAFPALLAFESNYDSVVDAHLGELSARLPRVCTPTIATVRDIRFTVTHCGPSVKRASG
jgi:hypothetical protein